MSDGPQIEVERGQRFALVPEWIIPLVSAQALRVYAALAATWSDWSTGECWPTRRTVASYLGISVDTYDRAVRDLVAAGAVRVEERRRLDGSQASNKLWITRVRPAAIVPPPLRNGAAPPSASARPLELDPEEPCSSTPVPRAHTPGDNADPPGDNYVGGIAAGLAASLGITDDRERRAVVAAINASAIRHPDWGPDELVAAYRSSLAPARPADPSVP